MAGMALTLQLVSGIILVMLYKPSAISAFDSIVHLMMEVNHGWFFRYLHANGATLFFFLMYVHIGRAFYYGGFRYPRSFVWLSGFAIYLIAMAAAFIGYVLPWGQMSFWGATVITNMFSSIPLVGTSLTLWLWGGFSVGDPTLGRFFSLHYLLPFVAFALMLIHLYFLHSFGSGKPSGFRADFPINGPFYPYFYLKDMFTFMCVLTVFLYFVYFDPDYFGHPDNYIEANPMVTPAHIVPEWYFLPFYAILRAVPNKLGGVILMAASLLVAMFYPFLANRFKLNPTVYYPRGLHALPFSEFLYWLVVCNFILLGHIGGCPVEEPYVVMGQCSTVFFFVSLYIMPVIYHIEVWYRFTRPAELSGNESLIDATEMAYWDKMKSDN